MIFTDEELELLWRALDKKISTLEISNGHPCKTPYLRLRAKMRAEREQEEA